MSDPIEVQTPKKRRPRKSPDASARVEEIKSPRSEVPPEPPLTLDPVAPPELPSEPLPDYDDQPHDGPHFREFLKVPFTDKRVLVVFVLVVLVLVGWFVGRPVYREVKVWRAMNLMELSQAEADAGNVPKALDLMRQAVLMAPANEEVFRLVRIFNAGIGDVPSLAALQQRMINGDADPDELVVLAEQSLKGGQPVLARAALDLLEGQASARKTIVEMTLLNADGNTKGAVELARAALPQLSPEDANRLLLATADMILFKDVGGSQEILKPLATRNDSSGISALRLLARQQLSRPGQGIIGVREVAVLLSKHPLATASDKLLEADLRIALDPTSQEAVVSQLMAVHSDRQTEDALEFARWLNRRQAPALAIDFIGRDRALANTDWLLVYLDAHAALERWGEVFSMLDAETVVDLSESIRLLFLARAAEKSGEKEAAEAAWREMQMNLLYEKPEVVSFVANYAARIGQGDQAFRAFSTMSKRRESALQGYLGMIRTWPTDAPLEGLIGTYEEFLEAFPNIGEAHVDLAYLRLLNDTNTREAAEAALDMHRREPGSLASLSVAALGLLKTGAPEEASMLYDGKSIQWSGAPSPWKAVRVAVLNANGRHVEAAELAATINAGVLRPREQELLGGGDASSPLNP